MGTFLVHARAKFDHDKIKKHFSIILTGKDRLSKDVLKLKFA